MQEDWEVKPQDYYEILQVHRSAEPEVIEAAYRQLSHKYHPDKNAKTEAKMKDINRAHEVLKDPKRRRQYDAWYQKNYGKDTFTTSFPPKPVVDPALIRFDNVIPGEKQTASFIVKNTGGFYKKIRIFVSKQNSWVKILRYTSLKTSDELPWQVEIEAEGDQWDTNYQEEIVVQLDKEETRVKVELQTQPISIKAVLLETKWLIAAVTNKIKTAFPQISIKKRYIAGAVGLFLLIMWAWGHKTFPQKPQAYQGQIYQQQQSKNHKLIKDKFINNSKDKIQKNKKTSNVSKSSKKPKSSSLKTSVIKPSKSLKKLSQNKSTKAVPIKTSFVVTGTFVDRNGNPVRARYWLTDQNDENHGSIWTYVLSNGTFKTVAVEDGEYRLHIEAEDYKTLEKKVTVAGKDVSLGRIILIKKSD